MKEFFLCGASYNNQGGYGEYSWLFPTTRVLIPEEDVSDPDIIDDVGLRPSQRGWVTSAQNHQVW